MLRGLVPLSRVHSHMRILLLVMVASLAGSCVVEPIGDRADVEVVEDLAVDIDWPEVEANSEMDDWPDARREMTCQEHYDLCTRTKLGGKHDDYGRSRCQDCFDLCRKEDGCWPAQTRAGRDCQYWKEKYRSRPQEKIP